MATRVSKAVESSVFYAPMIVNGHELPRDIRYARLSVNLESYHREYLASNKLDLRPPYQREACWTKQQKIAFIQSCFNPSMAIPPFYLCRKAGRKPSHVYSAVDSQQRSLAIRGFMSDEFPVTLIEVRSGPSGEPKHVKRRFLWSDLATTDEPGLIELKDSFLGRPLDIILFDKMDDDQQRKIFLGLNNGTPLNPDEVNYCPNYLSRAVLDSVFDRVFRRDQVVDFGEDEGGPGLAAFLQSSTRHRKRFRHMRMAHEVLILTAGLKGVKDDIDGDKYETGEPAPRSCKRTDRQKSAASMHGKLQSHDFEYDEIRLDTGDHSRIDDALELLHLSDTVEALGDVADMLTTVFYKHESLGRATKQRGKQEVLDDQLLPRNVIDPLCFLYAILDSGDITMGKITQGKLVAWLDKYYPAKRELDYDAATSDLNTMVAKFSIMRQLFNHFFGTDIQPWAGENELPQGALARIKKAVADATKK